MDRSSIKQYREGTHRTVSPEETLRRLETLQLDLGITRVGEVSALDRMEVPMAVAIRPNARSAIVSQGSGATVPAAKAAALMAAVERHHAEHVECALRIASAADLRAEQRTLDLDRLPRLARRCSSSESILWAQGRALDGTAIWVPFGLVHLDLRRSAPLGNSHFVTDSDGLGAGNTLEEAIVHGVCEAVARNALTVFHASADSERQRRRVDLESVDDSICRELLSRYARAGVDVAVWDLASELRIPCFLCCLGNDVASSPPAAAIALGASCHPSRAIALLRSLLKAAEHRVLSRVAAPDEMNMLGRKADAGQIVKLARLALESGTPPATRYLDAPTYESPSCEDDIAWLRQRLETSSVNVGIVDLSRAKYPVHVVRAVVEALDATSKRDAQRVAI